MRRAITIGMALALGLVAAILVAAALGSEQVSLFDLTSEQHVILFEIRLPRVFLGACVGASLAVAGASLQALLRNPLAEP
jgi:iron complex transport system permease protein